MRSLHRWWFTGLLLQATLSCFLQAQTMFVPEKVVVKASQINLRSSPQLSNSTIIGQLPSGTILDVLELPNKGALVELNGRWSPWYKLRTEDGRVGYALGDFLSPALTIQFEEALIDGNLPPLNWYGIYQKGKSSDEIRRIQVRKEPVYSEAMDETIYVLRTNQPDTAKFIIGTVETMQEGYAGPLGVMEAAGWNSTAEMSPGVQVPVETGREPALGSAPVSYILAATGCADWEENAMEIRNYRLRLVEVYAEDQRVQDLSPWFECEHGHPPTIQLLWYGDLDCDQIPDLLIHDCPYEIGCRTSLFLSSRARQNELVRKVGEFFWQGN